MKGVLKLGDLEIATLETIWEGGEADARALHDRFGHSRGITLSTVQSTLERLNRKGLLSRRKVSHAYIYSPAKPRVEVMAILVRDVLRRFNDVTPFDWGAVCTEVAIDLEQDRTRPFS